ncbi:hypothetical protein J7E71_12070 [Mesobacillus foraminis]|uniref:hypothetical protein n=1 Tax=Mesobacillus foraminis TaxID=279826 RepID=UPI001BE6AAB6|nr:hypothetical protein [Mesobacillus foraminis]MBT2756691.1 hypothetical protein [Mesobacillus foraminis]
MFGLPKVIDSYECIDPERVNAFCVLNGYLAGVIIEYYTHFIYDNHIKKVAGENIL